MIFKGIIKLKAITIKAYTNDISQIEAIKAVMKALKIKFELSEEKSSYNPEFTEKANQNEEEKIKVLKEIVAYTVQGEPLTKEQYIEKVQKASLGELTSIDDLKKEMQHW